MRPRILHSRSSFYLSTLCRLAHGTLAIGHAVFSPKMRFGGWEIRFNERRIAAHAFRSPPESKYITVMDRFLENVTLSTTTLHKPLCFIVLLILFVILFFLLNVITKLLHLRTCCIIKVQSWSVN